MCSAASEFAERTFLWANPAKFGTSCGAGYAVLAYFLVQTFAPQLALPVRNSHSPSWWMCVFAV
ncbi:MAG: hypothetical protein ACLTMP_10470 [Eggerthella lenta]